MRVLDFLAIARFAALAVLAIGACSLAAACMAAVPPLQGIDFGPYLNGSRPGVGDPVSGETIADLLSTIAPSTVWVRTYGCDNGLELIPPAAKKKGLKTAVGAWLGTDSGVNERQVRCLVALCRDGAVDVAIAGNEAIFGGSLDEAALAGWIARVRGQIAPTVPVTTAEPWNTWLEHPGLVDSVDLVYVNIHPYWYNVSVDRAVAWTAARYQEVQAISRGKPVIISETGWPSEGESRGDAMPSVQASERYLREFSAWADRDGISYFYFEAFDEAWKATPAAEAEAHWGIWYSNGTPKFPVTGRDR